MAIRVLRIMEYVFEDERAKEPTEANGFVPWNGVKIVGTTTIRSSTIEEPYFKADE